MMFPGVFEICLPITIKESEATSAVTPRNRNRFAGK